MAINWENTFRAVLSRATGVIEWDYLEQWIQAELFAECKKRSRYTGWFPANTEIPYATTCPVIKTKSQAKYGTTIFTKWADLVLHTENNDAWYWIELKAHHARDNESSLRARDAYRKDVAGLMGFNLEGTIELWTHPDIIRRDHYDEVLAPNRASLHSARHHFLAAFINLESYFSKEAWSPNELLQQVLGWYKYRVKDASELPASPKTGICKVHNLETGSCFFVTCDWLKPS